MSVYVFWGLGYAQQHLPFSVYRCEIPSVGALVSSHEVVVVELYGFGSRVEHHIFSCDVQNTATNTFGNHCRSGCVFTLMEYNLYHILKIQS